MTPLPSSARRRAVSLAAVIAAASVALPAVAHATPEPDTLVDPTLLDSEGTNGATPPTLDFQPCGPATAECAVAVVPLDYDDPSGPTIEVSVARVSAADPSQRIGTLFLNTGGPGGAPAQAVRDGVGLPAEVAARFDLIGIDPRGVGDSTPIRCFASADEQEALLGQQVRIPVNDEEVQTRFEVSRQYGEACAANAGPLLSHMSTANVARDMDLVRQALGEEQITYLGLSYGTHLGSVYANLFPESTRAAVLDGNLDAVAWTTGVGNQARKTPFDTRIQSAAGAAATLNDFLASCADAGPERCAFAADGDPFEKWNALLERTREAPIPITLPDGSPGEVDYSNLVGVTIGTLYDSPAAWASLAADLQGVFANVDTSAAMGRLMASADRAQLGGFADEPFDDSFAAVTCSETDNPTNQKAWVKNARKQARVFGAAGEFWAWGSLPCATWPVKDEDRYTGPWEVQTETPILLINNFFDPATSFESAVELQAQLGNAQLLPVAGYGHVAIGSGSTCAVDAFANYVINLELPPVDAVCTQDIVPFS
jgi:pimeloyl-ACP methyl ester carboxylesterase